MVFLFPGDINRSISDTNVSGLIGFSMYPSQPEASAFSRSPTMAYDVTATMGTSRVAGFSRSDFATA